MLRCKFHSEFHGNQHKNAKMEKWSSVQGTLTMKIHPDLLHDFQSPVQNKNADAKVIQYFKTETETQELGTERRGLQVTDLHTPF